VAVARIVCVLNLPDAVILIFQMVAGILTYTLLSIVTKNKNFQFLCEYLKQKLPKHKAKT